VLGRLRRVQQPPRHVGIGQDGGDDDITDPIGLRPHPAGTDRRVVAAELVFPEVARVKGGGPFAEHP